MKSLEQFTQGFTIIELLISISIIAILATIASVLYISTQATARDSRRITEIINISQAIEFNRDVNSKFYTYNTTSANRDFVGGLPQDPLDNRKYCVSLNSSNSTPPNACDINWQTNCLNSCNGANYITLDDALTILATNSIQSWTICTSMERANKPFCRQNIHR
ncbi:MAG: prepilin-type N-terminal cleavage/methylation domain-containing protein [Candidatus Daviesbacteria bacterium]|nr:prepilin-type N-terminal cleavage/methylation domain-containing protein [Candidatus Daviesbacteria bacterium]